MTVGNKVLITCPENWSGVQFLLCPVCGFEYMHQGKVEVFQRDNEDGQATLATIDEGVKVERVAATAVPGRRNSLYIHFTCENGCKSVLEIMQHKGNTHVSWVNE